MHVAKAGREEREMAGNTGAEEERPPKADCRRHVLSLQQGEALILTTSCFLARSLWEPRFVVWDRKETAKEPDSGVVSENILCTATGVSLLCLKWNQWDQDLSLIHDLASWSLLSMVGYLVQP